MHRNIHKYERLSQEYPRNAVKLLNTSTPLAQDLQNGTDYPIKRALLSTMLYS